MSNKLSKYLPCLYCKRSAIEMHHITQHLRKCFMKPENLEKLVPFFTQCVTDYKLLKRKDFHNYCIKKAGILSPVSMGHYFKQNYFKFLIIQLLIVLHKYNIFDWEMSEMIIYHLTDGDFCMSQELLNHLKQQVRRNRDLSSIDTFSNYQSLIKAVEKRARLDLHTKPGDKNENNEFIVKDDIISARLYLMDVNPSFVEQYDNLPNNNF